MSSNDGYDFNINDDRLFNNIGFGPYYQEPRPELSASVERNTTSHEHPFGELHSGANPPDLLSSLHGVDPSLAHYALNQQDASTSDAHPGPWDGLVARSISRPSRQHALLDITNFGGDLRRGGQEQYPSPEPHVGDFAEQHDAHSSTNGISQWPDLSVVTDSTSLDQSSTGTTSLHVCSSCGKSFPKRSGVKHHERIHVPAKKRAHRCSKCPRGFPNPKDLRRHQETHATVRTRYPCTEAGCPKSFTREDNIPRHCASAHASSSSVGEA